MPPRPTPVPEQYFEKPAVLTTDRLIAYLSPVFGEETARMMAKVLERGEMPDWNHVCWTLEQDDDMARWQNNMIAWMKQANRFMDSVEDQAGP